MNILKKEENLKILSNDKKFNNWITTYGKKNEGKKNIVRKKALPSQQLKRINRSYYHESSFIKYSNNNKTNKKNNNNLINSSYKIDNTYKKELPISPIYTKSTKLIK